ncbi:DivIVA domain-containing protein [Geobacter sp. SVR]|uniref:DivIVA domain-containing protein n=1 Tax=Geobacter sp. SVR TaxID=2495594 RepID=UPI00143EF826|nr:DivIVA domain-containing protein [Geobacter sp. SVR]BCS52187.1 cell division protein DivIVA [Geobacter sp. SVR]GCF85151.1 cell division protein DivIVA [Geobacter sp. SVR]
MKITPIDIQQQQFKGKMLGGLDPNDVDAFLQSVAGEMESLVRENNELKEQQIRHNREMTDMAEKERQLRETLLSAQRVIEEMKANAHKEAALIVSEAELKAERIVADAERQLGELKARIEEIRRQKVQFEVSLKSLLDSHARMLTGDDQK